MPGVSNTLDLARFQAAGMLYQMCPAARIFGQTGSYA